MKKYTKRILTVGLSAALVAPLVLSNQGLINAATVKVEKGPVTFVAVDDTKGAKLSVSGKEVKLAKLDQQTGSLVGIDTAWTGTTKVALSDKGEAAFADVKAGTYALTMNVNAKTNVTRFLNYAPKTAVTKTTVVLPTLDDSGKVDRKVSGAISGTIKDGASTKVAIVGKDTTWTTVADTDGKFSVYLPVGTYDIVIFGKDADGEDDKRNEVYKEIKVVAGQNATPLDEMDASIDWAVGSEDLDFTEGKTSTKSDATSTFTNVSKEYKGTLSVPGKVTAYTLDNKGTEDDTEDDVYTRIGEAVTKYDSKAKNEAFSIKLEKAQPNKTIVIVAEDEAFNRYSKIYKFAEINPSVKADTTKNEIGQPIELTYTDASKMYGASSKLTITAVDTKDPVDPEEPLVLKTPIKLEEKTSKAANDYSVSNGKIIINPSFFINKFDAKASDYEFIITAQEGFKDQTFTQTISNSSTAAASLTVKADKGTATGTTKLTVTASGENKIKYVVSSTAPSVAKAYSAGPSGSAYTSGTDISGVDAKDKKYLAVYEVNTNNQVVKFKALTLTATQIK